MKQNIENRLLAGGEVVAEIPSKDPGRRGWLAVIPVSFDSVRQHGLLERDSWACSREPDRRSGYVYRILTFELDKRLIEEDRHFGDEDMNEQQSVVVNTMVGVQEELAKNGWDSESLTEPWKTDYPL